MSVQMNTVDVSRIILRSVCMFGVCVCVYVCVQSNSQSDLGLVIWMVQAPLSLYQFKPQCTNVHSQIVTYT